MAIHRHHCLMILLLSAFLSLPVSAKNLALGNGHSCAISASGQVMCWGSNSSGQLGNGSGGGISSNTVIAKLDPKDVPIAIAAGEAHTCVLLKTGLVKCWGDNSAGQLGIGKISATETTPVSVVTLNGVKAIAAGAKHTCALHSWGFVKCWGSNQYGQLGNGMLNNSALPVAPSFVPSGLIDLAVGEHHSCVLTQNKSVSCWGGNAFGQLGNNSLINSSTTVNTLLTQPAMSIDAGNDHTCAIMANKTVQCWGWNGHSQQGPKKYSGNNPSPVAVPGLSNIGALALGYAHTCALNVAAAGKPKLLCLGANNHAELGLGSATAYDIEKPTPIIITDPIIGVAAGSDHTCANTTITGVPILKCWGNDTFGQLGLDPESSSLKTDPNNPGLKFSITPTSPGKVTVSSASMPLDAAPSPPIPAPKAPPPPSVACTYTYSEWTACKLESWGYWQTRVATSKNPAGCTGEAVLGQTCAPPPTPSPAQASACPANREWIYWYGGQPHTECGCTTVNADKDAAGKPIPWMGDKFIMVYFSGGAYKVDWAYRKDGLPIYQGPWYYAAKDGSVNNIPNGFTTNAVQPINGYTMIADNQWWAAMKPKKVYVSGQKLGTTYKNCGTAQTPASGGSGNPPPPPTSSSEKLAKSYNDQKTTIDTVMNELVTATLEKAAAQAVIQKEMWANVEPAINNLLSEKPAPAPTGTKISLNKAAYDAALQKQKNSFGKLNGILEGLLKLDSTGPKIVDGGLTRTILTSIAKTYVGALTVIMVDGPLVDTQLQNCMNDPIQNQHIYKGASSGFADMIQCLPIQDVKRLENGFVTALSLTMHIIKTARPSYYAEIQDRVLHDYVPYVIPLYGATRFWGNAASTALMQLYADRLKTIPDTGKLTPDTQETLEPDYIVLYNPGSKKMEWIKTCSVANAQKIMNPALNPPPAAGELAVWSDNYNCMLFKNFIKAATDPAMNKSLTCNFWNSARLGKACLSSPLKTSWFDRIKPIFESIFVSTAYALEKCSAVYCYPAGNAGFCQKKELWSNYYPKCKPDQGGKQLDEPDCDDSNNSCADFLKACAEACAPAAAGASQPVCKDCNATPACGNFDFLFINDNNKAGVVKTTQLSFTNENGKIVCPPGSPFSCGIPYTLKKCLKGNPYCSAKGYPNDTVGCLSYDANAQKNRCTACNTLQVCAKSKPKPSDPFYTQEFCDKCTDECAQKNPFLSVCGNGKVEVGEECDDGSNNSDKLGCTKSCKKNLCGNNTIDPGEECDDDSDDCVSCINQLCGNGKKEGSEECDDSVSSP